jgi:hypothetical protein
MIFAAGFFGSRLEQLAMLAARHRVPASYQFREFEIPPTLLAKGIE